MSESHRKILNRSGEIKYLLRQETLLCSANCVKLEPRSFPFYLALLILLYFLLFSLLPSIFARNNPMKNHGCSSLCSWTEPSSLGRVECIRVTFFNSFHRESMSRLLGTLKNTWDANSRIPAIIKATYLLRCFGCWGPTVVFRKSKRPWPYVCTRLQAS